MSVAIALSAAALLAAGWTRMVRHDRRLAADLASLAECVRELSTRVDAAEADVGHAVTQAEIAESLLVEKGVADEEDVEAVRRRFNGSDATPAPGYVPRRDGELN